MPVVASSWGCGCGGSVAYAAPTVIAPAPIYVVNQGPDYTGPGIMVPYRTWTPAAPYIGAGGYPYMHGYGYGRGYGYGYGHGYGYGRGYGYGHGYGYGVHRTYFAPRSHYYYGRTARWSGYSHR
jgi:hypothetical protein